MGIFVKSTQSTLISSNTLRDNHVSHGNPASNTGNSQIWAPLQNVKIMHNAIQNHADNISPVRGGAVDLYSISDHGYNGHYSLHNPHNGSGKEGQEPVHQRKSTRITTEHVTTSVLMGEEITSRMVAPPTNPFQSVLLSPLKLFQ